MTQRTIDALPLNGRNFTDLIALVPGARPDPSLSTGANVEIFGERAGAVSYLVDGAENNDPVNGGALLRFTQDSIKEFEVITTGYEAEFGRAQGGVANIVTRSGSDQWTGRGFLFARNDRFDASNIPDPSPVPTGYVKPEPPTLERYQWGGTAGGPIARDRAFFFGSFEKLNETRGINIDQSKIPAFVLSGIATPSHVEDFGLAPKRVASPACSRSTANLSTSNRLTGSVNRITLTNSGVDQLAGRGHRSRCRAPPAIDVAAGDERGRSARPPSSARRLFLESTGTLRARRERHQSRSDQRSEPLLLLLRSGFLQTGAPFGGADGSA